MSEVSPEALQEIGRLYLEKRYWERLAEAMGSEIEGLREELEERVVEDDDAEDEDEKIEAVIDEDQDLDEIGKDSDGDPDD